MSDIYRAKEAFMFVDRHGVPRVMHPGDLVADDDPSFKGREALFEKVEAHVQSVEARRSGAVETATSDPGSRRSTSRRFGKSVAAKTVPDDNPPVVQDAPPTEPTGDKE